MIKTTLFFFFFKLKIKQLFLAYQDEFCAWFGLVRLPTETARVFFLNHFLKQTALSIFSLLIKPFQCLGKNILYLIFCPVTKILSRFSKLFAISKHRGKNFAMMGVPITIDLLYANVSLWTYVRVPCMFLTTYIL